MTKLSIEEEMKLAKKAHNEKMAKLKRKQAAEEKRITDRVLELLKGDEHAELFGQLYQQAFQELLAEREERSRKAKEAREMAPVGADNEAGATSLTSGY
ncbi:hypothetical protein [Glutamicibacter halophytocola]|uniref:hypothetical protein n=1 Tax=Glutamicibacter halophytocola TaxID=1933880 RepID=UPI001892A1CF|nr:hypothetical protein [Glutamicibacter halophytocola]